MTDNPLRDPDLGDSRPDGDAEPAPPPATAALHLAGLVASRLCHDLVSPLGAIGNGLELMTMPGGAGHGPELDLVAESVENAQARIRVFRVAFGLAQADQRMGAPEIAALLADLSRAGRLVFDWQVDGDQSRREVKMVLLAALCLETALPRGGRVLICRSGHDYTGQGWRLVADAPRTRPDPALWSLLGPGAETGAVAPMPLAGLAAAQVQFALLPVEARQARRRLHWEMDNTGAEISF